MNKEQLFKELSAPPLGERTCMNCVHGNKPYTPTETKYVCEHGATCNAEHRRNHFKDTIMVGPNEWNWNGKFMCDLLPSWK